jgi:2'-5' RNA ligase
MRRATAVTTERLFIAVPLTDEVRDAVRAALPRALPGRLVQPEHWHLTLRFLGETDARARDALVARLRQASGGGELAPAFDLRLGGLGAFPNPGRARVLWLGAIEGGAPFERLADRIEELVRSCGFEADTRPHRAHLTLSRLDPLRNVDALVRLPVHVAPVLHVHAIHLIRSELGRSGPRYDTVSTIELAPAV